MLRQSGLRFRHSTLRGYGPLLNHLQRLVQSGFDHFAESCDGVADRLRVFAFLRIVVTLPSAWIPIRIVAMVRRGYVRFVPAIAGGRVLRPFFIDWVLLDVV